MKLKLEETKLVLNEDIELHFQAVYFQKSMTLVIKNTYSPIKSFRGQETRIELH